MLFREREELRLFEVYIWPMAEELLRLPCRRRSIPWNLCGNESAASSLYLLYRSSLHWYHRL